MGAYVDEEALLDLGNSGLREWPTAAIARAGPAAIRRLDLSANRLTAIPGEELAKLVNLEELNVGYNQLQSLPPEIGRLTKLRVLRAECNHLSAVPREIGKLEQLTWLNLQHNGLTTLPVEIGLIPHLTDFLVVTSGDVQDRMSEKQLVWRRNALANLPSGDASLLAHLRTEAAKQLAAPGEAPAENDALAAQRALARACLQRDEQALEGCRRPTSPSSSSAALHSEHFRRMLGAGMREARTRVIEVTEYSAGTVRALLGYLYTGELRVEAGEEEPAAALVELLRAAHFYALPRLVQRVEERLCRPGLLGAASALRALVAADQIGCARLRAAAMGVVRAHGAAVVRTGEYRELAAAGHADLIVEISEALAPR
eukprot:tig00000480_g1313.t1